MSRIEQALTFKCGAETLTGIIHNPNPERKTGIIIVAGAPQYRVGAHRLFVTLSRHIADEGYAVLRFDRRGTGDSSGAYRTFETMQEDLASAVEVMQKMSPEVERIVLLGLCDGASAILLGGLTLEKVAAAVLVNPWAPTDEGRARALLTSYYWSRIRSRHAWKALFSNLAGAGRALVSIGRKMSTGKTDDPQKPDMPDFIPKMFENWQQFSGDSLVILSRDDITAASFDAVLRKLVGWRALSKPGRISRRWVKNADHTFSSARLTGELADAVIGWLNATTQNSRDKIVGTK